MKILKVTEEADEALFGNLGKGAERRSFWRKHRIRDAHAAEEILDAVAGGNRFVYRDTVYELIATDHDCCSSLRVPTRSQVERTIQQLLNAGLIEEYPVAA